MWHIIMTYYFADFILNILYIDFIITKRASVFHKHIYLEC